MTEFGSASGSQQLVKLAIVHQRRLTIVHSTIACAFDQESIDFARHSTRASHHVSDASSKVGGTQSYTRHSAEPHKAENNAVKLTHSGVESRRVL